MADSSQMTELKAERLTAEDKEAFDKLEELLKAGMAEPIDGAKQVLSTNGLLLTVYFAAISFGGFRDFSFGNKLIYGLMICLLCTPILLFLLSTYFALRVYIPVTHYPTISSPQLMKLTCEYIINYRYDQLKRSIFSMELGFGLLLICFIAYLMCAPTSDEILKVDLINRNLSIP